MLHLISVPVTTRAHLIRREQSSSRAAKDGQFALKPCLPQFYSSGVIEMIFDLLMMNDFLSTDVLNFN